MKKNITGIILAAGKSVRTSLGIPKQFYCINNKPVIWYSINAFLQNKDITDVICVIPKSYYDISKKIAMEFPGKKKIKIVVGGDNRQESSFIALKNCDANTDYVLIHDAARVLINDGMITNVIKELVRNKAITTAFKATDSIAFNDGDRVMAYCDRNSLIHIQTPQGFDFNTILVAHNAAFKNAFNSASDDCSLVIKYTEKYVKVVFANENNLKITTPEDIVIAESLLNKKK